MTTSFSAGFFEETLLMAGPAVAAACPTATTFLARTTGLDVAHTNAYTELICGLVSDGIWTKLDALYVFATADLTTAKLNLVSATYNATSVTSDPNFVVDRGSYGQAGTHDGALNTHFNPTTAVAPNYTRNSAHYSAWGYEPSIAEGFITMGMDGGAGFSSILYAEFSDTLTYYSLNSNAGGNASTAVTLGSGQFIVNRPDSANIELYNKGALVGTTADTSTALANQPFHVLGGNNNGTSNASARKISMASIGASLSAAEVTLFYNRLRTYMTAVGVP